MDLMSAIDTRISCRSFADTPVEQETLDALQDSIDKANEESGLEFQLVGPRADGAAQDHPVLELSRRMFTNSPAHYIACVGPDTNLAREQIGYYGERIILTATMLGLGTCWIAGTFDRATARFQAKEGSVLHCVIPVAYPVRKMPLMQRTIRAGLRKRDKRPAKMYQGSSDLSSEPQWVQDALIAVVKAPSAINEQPVVFVREDGNQPLKATLPVIKSGQEWTDLGIAKYHFEVAAAAEGINGRWEWGADGSFTTDLPQR
jgi:hypothetical protein